MFTTLIAAEALHALDPATVRVFDCRFDLADPGAGETRFRDAHIPGATYLHLDRDLAGPATPGRTGRHPLPERTAFRRLLREHGVEPDVQMVAYDDAGGMFAARLWWMARWAGHDGVAVLDGGYPAWREWRRHRTPAGQPVATPATPAAPTPPAPTCVSMSEVRDSLQDGTLLLVDARARDRFDGSNETIDPKGGHIPGAVNAPFADNLDPDGRFAPPTVLRRRFETLLGDGGAVACYCGSGVTAAHDILATVHAGLPEPALYAGSWSEWITDPDNPIDAGTV